MASERETIRSYTADLLAGVRHVLSAVERQTKDEHVDRIARAGATVRGIHTLLTRQSNALERHLEFMGGKGVMGTVKDAVTAVTGTVAGAYDKVRGETASRALRDDYTALHFIFIATSMLHTTAIALGDGQTAELTSQHMQELPPAILALQEVTLHAVVADLGADKTPIHQPDAGTLAFDQSTDAWRGASSGSASRP